MEARLNSRINLNWSSLRSLETFKLEDDNLNDISNVFSKKINSRVYDYSNVLSFIYDDSIRSNVANKDIEMLDSYRFIIYNNTTINNIVNKDSKVNEDYSFTPFANSNNLFKGWVIEMDNEYQIKKILLQNKLVHLSLFILSIVMIIW